MSGQHSAHMEEEYPQRFSASRLGNLPEPPGRVLGSHSFAQQSGQQDRGQFGVGPAGGLPQGLDLPREGVMPQFGQAQQRPGDWRPPGQGPLMPPGNIIAGSGRGPPGMFANTRGRGTFQGFSRGGRGFGQGGRWDLANEDGGRGGDRWHDERGRGGRRGFPGDADRAGGFGRFGGRFQGRGFAGRRGFGRWGGNSREQGYEKRQDSWHEHEAGPKKPAVDPAVLERRRASNAARLARQAAILQVSNDLAGDDLLEAYNRILAESSVPSSRADVRSLYMYPAFAAEEATSVQASTTAFEDQTQAFEHCLQMYQDAQQGCKIVQSEHGNFLMPLV